MNSCSSVVVYNAYTLLTMCHGNNNKLKIHPKGMATFKKIITSVPGTETQLKICILIDENKSPWKPIPFLIIEIWEFWMNWSVY